MIALKNDKKGRKAKGVQSPLSRRYEKRIAQLAGVQPPRHPDLPYPLDGPLILRAFAVVKRVKKIRWPVPFDPTEPDGRIYCPRTPDWDNCGKSFGDGMKKAKVIRDDARIVDGRVVTVFGREGEAPFAEIYIFAHKDSGKTGAEN